MYRLVVGVSWEIDSSFTADEARECKAMVAVSMDNPIERLLLTSVKLVEDKSRAVLATAYFLFVPYTQFELGNECSSSRRVGW